MSKGGMMKAELGVVGAKRLLKLAKFLHKLPKEKFDYSIFVCQGGNPMLEALKFGKHACGSVACALGWTPAVFPRLAQWMTTDTGDGTKSQGMPTSRTTRHRGFSLGEELFQLSSDAVHFLFDPNWTNYNSETSEPLNHNPLDYNATPKEVAKHIRDFVKANYQGRATLDYGN